MPMDLRSSASATPYHITISAGFAFPGSSMMRSYRLIYVAIFCASVFPVNSRSQERTPIVEETLRQLEKDISAVRGLAFKSPVTAKVIARAKDAPKGVQGYYSIKEKTLY